ncbi:hypothetical protein BJ165DRAFT_1408004 [Panaeolus papilionaceus]|nr:hypothetical protein BJ165DRAFT_1408004 [Panaeolus papilionaceus]
MSESQFSPLRAQPLTTLFNWFRPSWQERGYMPLKLDAGRGGSGFNFPTTTEPPDSLNNDESLLFRTALEAIDERHDILIAVMGLKGVGKSTFIDAIKKESNKRTDNAPQMQRAANPPPKGINPTSFPVPGTKSSLVLIDTPDLDILDHPARAINVEIMEMLHAWVKEEYSSSPGKTLSGVLYLHRITDVYFAIEPAITISWARDLIGGDVFDKICLTNTFWDWVPADFRDRFDKKEEEINNNQWKMFGSIKPASITSRFDTRIPGSARRTLIKLLDHANKKAINKLNRRRILDKLKKSQPLNPDEVFYCQRQQLRTSVLYDDEDEQFPVPQSS